MTQSKTERIFQTLRQRIESGDLAEGTKLMSLRQASDQFGASKNVMVTVYDKLVAHGLARSRRGSGFYVTRLAPSIAEPTNLREASDTVSLLHVQLDRPYTVLAGDGRPPESWMMTSMPAITLPAGEGGYGSPHGLLALRECIAATQVAAGIMTTPAQIVTTFGANNALDLVIRRFTRPGDTVLVDDPGYYPLFSKLKLSEVNFVGIPRTPTGPDPKALELAAKKHWARLFFTQSLAQNPTGCSIELPTAHAVLKVADQCEMLVIDDDPFIDLPGVRGTRLAALDQFRRVIQIGSYSKILSPSLRSGYLIAEPEIAASMAELKMILAVNSSSHTERLIAEAILSRRFEKLRLSLRKRLDRERREGMQQMERLGFRLFAPPDDGLYGYVHLPEGLDDMEVSHHAAQKGILLAPGSLFRVSGQSNRPSMRVNWSRVQDSRFYSFLRTLT
ncbi:MAG: PLP-dependent aminotransferase family protein [Roseovarius sp.]|uniref:aminotransferase-like domain-containing protein n=1 Tax=Roseovarius sp. TaxID=1486281 RepID=UPI0032EE5926